MVLSKNVLIVDDDLDFGDSIADILQGENYATTTVDSGEKAVRAAEGKDFHIVLMDIKMPGMGGIEALKRIKKIRIIAYGGIGIYIIDNFLAVNNPFYFRRICYSSFLSLFQTLTNVSHFLYFLHHVIGISFRIGHVLLYCLVSRR